MARIQGFRIRNYRALKDITLGRLWNERQLEELSSLTAVIGRNGVGKSTMLDAFGFVSDCLRLGVEEACDAQGRGGFHRIRSQGATEPIEFEIYYKEELTARPITYQISIDVDSIGRPYVASERLRQRRRNQSSGRPFSFLILTNGQGVAWKGEDPGVLEEKINPTFDDLIEMASQHSVEESSETEVVQLEDNRRLGIATLGSLKQHPRISAFRRFIEGWHLSYFSPNAARSLPLAGPQRHLNVSGDNLGNVVQFMEREHSKSFKDILKRIATKIPGIQSIDTHRTEDGRLLLRFNNNGFGDPFYAQQMSDGTLKVFAYLLLLEDPEPPPFLCIEEPENGLYHKLLESLAEEFRAHTQQRRASSQIFVTTHQPYFVDALRSDEVWIMTKGSDGFSKVTRASADPTINAMVGEGLPLGSLWYSNYLDSE